MRHLITLFIIIPFASSAQLSKQDSVWLPFKTFIGKWQGDSDGQPGKGKYERSYEVIFNKKFIQVKNKSTYAPRIKIPKEKSTKTLDISAMIKPEKHLFFGNFT